jgi:hypothetical protein
VERPAHVGGEEAYDPQRRLARVEEAAQDRGGAGEIATCDPIRQLLDRTRAGVADEIPDVVDLDAPAADVEGELLDFANELAEVRPEALDQLLDRPRRNGPSVFLGEEDDGIARGSHVREAREAMRRTGLEACGEQPFARIDRTADEDQARALPQRREDGLHALLGGLVQRFGATDDEHLRPAEQEGRAEVVERLLETLRAVVRPEGTDVVGATLGRQPLAQDGERALDQERLLAVEQIVSGERRGRERSERIGAAQKPSIDCW